MANWFKRRGGWYSLWVREAYEIEDSEHLHVMVHCPSSKERRKLLAALRKWYPGGPEVADVRPVLKGRAPCDDGRDYNCLDYLLKHSSTQAIGPPGHNRRRRETFNRKHGAAVAPVLGERSGVSRTLDAKAIAAWEADQAVTARAKARITAERAEIAYRERHAAARTSRDPEESREDEAGSSSRTPSSEVFLSRYAPSPNLGSGFRDGEIDIFDEGVGQRLRPTRPP